MKFKRSLFVVIFGITGSISAAHAYEIKWVNDEGHDIGLCDNGSSFAGQWTDKYTYTASGPYGWFPGQSKDSVIRHVCGE